ncbi:unnamed protein product [Coffea canephora]|uniref:Uncharacterized protein n=1 Tax=Coffea canephora TaxID=49390 RepID=A0A068V2T4_COFCA|nr:unnamed protein product [Coffea canephora]
MNQTVRNLEIMLFIQVWILLQFKVLFENYHHNRFSYLSFFSCIV